MTATSTAAKSLTGMSTGVTAFLIIMGIIILVLVIRKRLNPFAAILCVAFGILFRDGAGLGGFFNEWADAIWNTLGNADWPGGS